MALVRLRIQYRVLLVIIVTTNYARKMLRFRSSSFFILFIIYIVDVTARLLGAITLQYSRTHASESRFPFSFVLTSQQTSSPSISSSSLQTTTDLNPF